MKLLLDEARPGDGNDVLAADMVEHLRGPEGRPLEDLTETVLSVTRSLLPDADRR